MSQRKQQRNDEIIRMHEQGAPLATLASQFGLSEGRIRAIVEAYGPLESLKKRLRSIYGTRPALSSLPDDAPLDVLLLYDADAFAWSRLLKRLSSLEPPVRNLGDLRQLPKRRLLRLPHIGPRTLAALKLLFPDPRRSKQRAAR